MSEKLHRINEILDKIEKYVNYVDTSLEQYVRPRINLPELHNLLDNIKLESSYVLAAIKELRDGN